MVRVCVDDPILDANGEFTGFYREAGPFCPEVSVRTLCYLNLDRESVGGAVARDSSAFYSAYLAAAGGQSCTVHSNEPSTEEPECPTATEPLGGRSEGSSRCVFLHRVVKKRQISPVLSQENLYVECVSPLHPCERYAKIDRSTKTNGRSGRTKWRGMEEAL